MLEWNPRIHQRILGSKNTEVSFLIKKKQEANQSSEGLTSPLELALIRALSFFFLDFIWQKKFKSVLSPLNDLHCGLEGLKKIII